MAGPPLWRQARVRDLALAIAPGLGTAMLVVLQARLLSGTIAGVFLGGRRLPTLVPALAALLAVIAARAVLVWMGELAAAGVAIRVKTGLRERLCAHLFALGPAYTRGERTGELATAAVEGIEALDAYFRHYLPQVALAALVPATVLAFIAPADPLAALILLLTAPWIPVLALLIGRAAQTLTRRRWELLGLLGAHFLDVLAGLTTLKIFGQSRRQVRTIGEMSERFRAATLEVLRVAFLSALVLEIIAMISTAIVAVTVGLKLLYGRMTFETALFILVLAPEFYLPLRLLGGRFHAGAAAVAAAERILEILNTPAPSLPPAGARPEAGGARTGGPGVEDLRLDGVGVVYSDGRRALAEVSFVIPRGQTIALVGRSGAGKSTIAHLLLRFLEPTEGRILVGERPLSAWPAAAWRARIAWVPQAPSLFHDTLLANIRLARPDAPREAVERAVHAAHLDGVVAGLARGYETVVGEHGMRLSGGEAQRVALARAFLKDAPLLILDEPTSSLDPDLEAALQDSVARLMQGRTTLVIAHRLHTLWRADRIIVLDGGRVVEAGTHRELMGRAGLYRRLVEIGSRPDTVAAGGDP